MMKNLLKLAFGIVATTYLSAPHAGVFSIDTTVFNNESSNRGAASFTNVDDTFGSLSDARLRLINPAYTGVEVAIGNIDYRGLAMTATYPAASSPLLLLSVPALGINETFLGATRNESQRQLVDFLKKNGNGILGRIGKEQAAKSPVDPIAGNPNSLMSQLVMQDFMNSFTDFATNIKAPSTVSGPATSLIGIGSRFGQYQQGGATSKALTIPLSYTFRNDLDPRRQLSFNLPITLGDVEGSKSYYAALRSSYRFPMNDNWALTPAVNYALAGSADLGALASVASLSLTSSYLFRGERFNLAIGNMLGYYTTMKASSGEYSYDPDISNTVLRNGLMFSNPVSVGGRKMSVEYSLVDTRFFGDELFVDHYNEVGISLGTNKSAASARSYLRAGVSYLHAEKSQGFAVNLGYWF